MSLCDWFNTPKHEHIALRIARKIEEGLGGEVDTCFYPEQRVCHFHWRGVFLKRKISYNYVASYAEMTNTKNPLMISDFFIKMVGEAKRYRIKKGLIKNLS